MKTDAFGKALLPRPQSTVRYHSTNGHERQVGLLEDRVHEGARAQMQGRSLITDLMIQGRMCESCRQNLHG